MFFTSDDFNRRIRESGKRKTVVDIVTSSGVVLAENIVVSSGSINVDQNAAIRRYGNVIIPDKRLVPSITSDLLLPYGTEIRIRQGIVYGDGSEELIPVGTFVLDTTSWKENDGPIPSIEFFDRAMIMDRTMVGTPEDFSGWLPEDVIRDVINYWWPELEVTFGDGLTSTNLPGGTVYTSGHFWDIAQQMARRMGGEVFFDVMGNPTVRALPSFDDNTTVDDAVWDVNVGSRGILVGADRSITRKDTYSNVYVVGVAQQGGVLPAYNAININPESPTNRNGPFRPIGIKITDNTLTTESECFAVATAKLAEYTRLSQNLSFECVPNPAVDVGDIVSFQYSSGETQVGLIESYSLPIGKGAMTGKVAVSRL